MDASLQLFKSTRLRKVFEIILAFGNYMNSGRRGVVQGFKLESLAKVRMYVHAHICMHERTHMDIHTHTHVHTVWTS